MNTTAGFARRPELRVAVLGAGAWGTALAVHLARRGHAVSLWGHRREHVAALALARENRRYLPGVAFPPSLALDSELEQALHAATYTLVAVPSTAFRETVDALAVCASMPVFWATKGLDVLTGRPLHERARAVLGDSRGLGVLSGPSFAAEVARGLPTAITVAATSLQLARRFAALVHGPTFRAYVSTDLVGVEIGGASKNVIAIASGISDGLGLGANARAGLVTRGLAEMRRLGKVLGARPTTLIGLSGLGDLVLTATDDQSRNRRFGMALGRGTTVDAAREAIGAAIEGIPAARALTRLAAASRVEMPISEQVQAVLEGVRTPRDAVEALMSRTMKAER